MTEEKKEEQVQEEPQVDEVKDQKEGPVEVKSDKPKRVKVTSMTYAQVQAGLKVAMETQGGYGSRHAQALLARQELLEKLGLAGSARKAA